jgi:hypothetical protein
MKKSITTAICLVGLVGLYWFAQAGDLEPPGPPAETMVTLQEIYDACTAGGACGVPATGQTECWDEPGDPIDCAGTGQDGEYQTGVAVGPRFTDNGDGTVTDNLTRLIWLKNADCFGLRTWTEALSDANSLQDGSCGLTDGSVAGNWRLPNIRELHTLFDYGQYDPALPSAHSFSGVQLERYWSSSTRAKDPFNAWCAFPSNGSVGYGPKQFTSRLWPVRGGQ